MCNAYFVEYSRSYCTGPIVAREGQGPSAVESVGLGFVAVKWHSVIDREVNGSVVVVAQQTRHQEVLGSIPDCALHAQAQGSNLPSFLDRQSGRHTTVPASRLEALATTRNLNRLWRSLKLSRLDLALGGPKLLNFKFCLLLHYIKTLVRSY